MIGKKLWYMVTLVALMMLPLAGCSGGGSNSTSKDGVAVTFSGKVGKTTLKSVFATADLGTLTIIDAQDGATLGTGVIDGSGSFKDVKVTLPTAKATLVFKADVNLAGTPFRSIVPMDLSNPPAAGITGNNSVNITISQESTNIAITTSAMLGVTGILGDAGATLNSVNKTFADAAQQVVNNGGQVLSYSTAGNVQLTGSLSNAALLPAMDAAALSVADLNDVALGGDIQSTFIPTNKPIVNFTVTNKATGKGIKGLRTFALHVAKLVPENAGSNSYWQNYIASGLPVSAMPATTSTTISNPTTDAADRFNTTTGAKIADGYKVIDHGDGSYTVTFGADITKNTKVAYDANATTRLGISVRSVAVPGVVNLTPGAYAGPINPLTGAPQATFTSQNTTNLIYDFVPATGAKLAAPARDIVTADACAQCHFKTAFAVPNNGLSGHTGSRTDTKLCVMCHTNQFGGGEGEFVTFIHRIHMGEVLNEGGSFKPVTGSLVTYNEQTYPQDIRNCTTCHKGKDSWKDKPSQKSCGSCHNAVDFTAHKGGQPTDQNCAGCHADATLLHVAMTKPDPIFNTWNGTTTIRSNAGYMAVEGSIAAAAKITYDVKEVKAVATADPAFVNPSITFKLLKNNTGVVFGDYSASNGVRSFMDGFVGTPGIYFAFAVPQDGIAAPADFNATAGANMKNIYYTSLGKTDGSTPAVASTLTFDAATGYYTATLTAVKIPVSATMLTGGIGYQYDYPNNQPLTQKNVTGVPAYDLATKIGGLIMASPNVAKVATNYTARRAIVSNAKCNACHVQLGVKPQFHVGQRNDAPTCAFCHNTNRVNSGWSANAKDAIHSLHAASKRVNKFSWEVSAGAKYWAVTFPGTNASNRPTLKNCEMCHLAGMYDFSNSAYTATTYKQGTTANVTGPALTERLLYSTVATGTTPASISSIITGTEPVPGTYYSPFVTAGTAYGAGFGFSAATGAITPAADTTLVISPVTASCYSCHDASLAKAHMVQFGGSIYEPRSTALAKKEQCLLCHGTAQNVSNVTVPTIKAIHRWW